MKFSSIVLVSLIWCSVSAMELMELEELQPLVKRSQNLENEKALAHDSDDSSDGTFDESCIIHLEVQKVEVPRDPLGLGIDVWRLIFKDLTRKDAVNLCYVSHFFNTYIHPLIYLNNLNASFCLHLESMRFSCLDLIRKNYVLGQQVAKVGQISQKMQKVSPMLTLSLNTSLYVKNVMEPHQEAVHKLLNQVELRRYGLLFQIVRGKENFDYLKKTYTYELQQRTIKALAYMVLSDPIFVGVYLSGLTFGAVLIGQCIYWSFYNQLITSQEVDYTYIYPCSNCSVESAFYNPCPGNENASCFVQWPGFPHFEKIIGNKSDWIEWMERACTVDKTFLGEIVNNVSRVGEYVSRVGNNFNHSRISGIDSFTTTSRDTNDDVLWVKQIQTSCYILKASAYSTYSILSGAFIFGIFLFNIFFFFSQNMY